MEYSLRLVSYVKGEPTPENVLILILMEYSLRQVKLRARGRCIMCLNPYSNGI